MNKYNIFVLISLIFLKINVFVSERDSPTEIIPKLTEILRNVTYRFAKGIITQTNASKNFLLKEIGNVNVVVIPNPIRPIKIDETIKREKIILNVGRLVEKKGQKYLIEAFSKIDSKGWKLIFLGDGPLKSDLIKLAINNNIINKVIFMGTSKEVDLWLNKSSIFAFPSILEGFPNALAEAMSAGLPCVSFNCETGPSELISNEVNGFLIEVGDVNTLAEKLELLMNNPDIRNIISKNALQVGDMLNSNKISKYYLDFCFNNIL
jgi:glycosyltransferase involved in cell wall biosynthesis